MAFRSQSRRSRSQERVAGGERPAHERVKDSHGHMLQPIDSIFSELFDLKLNVHWRCREIEVSLVFFRYLAVMTLYIHTV